MKWNSFGMGVLATLMVFVTMGAAMAAIVAGGNTINVPVGKFAIYFFIDDSYTTDLRDAVRYWEGNSTLTATQAATIFNGEVKGFAKEYVLSAKANIDAEAARQAALNSPDPTSE